MNGPPVKAGDWYHLFLVSFVVVGPIEELCKYAAVRFSVYRSAEFNEPLDGLVYSSAAALGFASLENVFFTIQNGPAVMLVRAPLSTLGHVFFAAMWGYSLGVHRLGIARRGTVGRGLFASMFLHGLFNFVLLTQNGSGAGGVAPDGGGRENDLAPHQGVPAYFPIPGEAARAARSLPVVRGVHRRDERFLQLLRGQGGVCAGERSPPLRPLPEGRGSRGPFFVTPAAIPSCQIRAARARLDGGLSHSLLFLGLNVEERERGFTVLSVRHNLRGLALAKLAPFPEGRSARSRIEFHSLYLSADATVDLPGSRGIFRGINRDWRGFRPREK